MSIHSYIEVPLDSLLHPSHSLIPSFERPTQKQVQQVGKYINSLYSERTYLCVFGVLDPQSESFCNLNLEGLLCLGLQSTEALLDFGSKVTQKPALTSSKKKMAHIHYANKLNYAIAIQKVYNGAQQRLQSKSTVTFMLSAG